MPITVQRIRRLEIFSDWVAAGGVRTYVIQNATNILATSNITLGEKLTFTIPLESTTSPLVFKGVVLRLDQDDVTFDEWKVVTRVDDTQAGTAQITAGTFANTDLVMGAFLSRVDSDGTRNYDFESVGLDPTTQIAQWVLPATPLFVTIGTITPTAPIDMAYAWDKPLGALQRMAATLGMELDVRRVGSVGYAIDLIPEIGFGAATCDVRAGKNITRLSRSISSDGQATRIFPQGQADADNVRATMAQASWLVTSVTTAGGLTVIGLADPGGGDGPIGFDGQLAAVGGSTQVYLRHVDGAFSVISASSATDQTVTVPATDRSAVGDLIDFRTDVAGSASNDLTWLDSPQDVATWGVVIAPLDVGDTPGHRNLARNSALRSWPSGNDMPDDWSIVDAPGTITIARQTESPYVLSGNNSIKLITTQDGQGVETSDVRITPSPDNPYESGFGSVWTVSDPGTVRVELVFTTPDGEITQPILPAVASNSEAGQWEDIGVSGQDAHSFGATLVRLRIVQNGVTPATFYVGRAQLTQSPAQLPFVEGSGGTKLWQAANEQLRTNGAPTVAYEATIADLARIDPVTWGQDCTITVGGSVLVTDPRFPLQILTRIIEVQRNYSVPGNTSITISSKPDDLSGSYARPKKKGRILPSFFATPSAPTVSAVQADLNTDGNPSVLVIATPNAGSLKVAISTSGIPTDADVEASTAISGSQAVVLFGAVTVDPGETLYGKVFAYRGDNGAGLRSPPMPFSIPFAAIRRDAPWADGGYALAASDSAGLVADSGVTDSSGLASRRIVLSLAKASAGAPDDLRSVPDGGGYNRTTSTYVDSSGRVVTIRRATSGTTVSGDTLGDRTDNLTSTGLASTGDVAGVNAAAVAGGASTSLFRETCDTDLITSGRWTLIAGAAPTITVGGTVGPNVAVATGLCEIMTSSVYAYNPSKLHRIRTKLRQFSDGGTEGTFYVGVRGLDSTGAATNNNGGFVYVAVRALSLHAVDGFQEYTGFFTGASSPYADGGALPSSDPNTPAPLDVNTVSIQPVVLMNVTAGDGVDLFDYVEIDVFDEVASAFTYGGFSGVGSIAPSVTQGDSAGGRVILRGRQSGTARNGDSITFDPPYQNIPIVNFHGGALNEPRAKWGPLGDGTETGSVNALPQYEDFAAQGLSASGCTAIGRLRQKGATTSDVSDAFGAPTVMDFGSVGDTTGSATLTHPPSLGNAYSVNVSGLLDLNHSGSSGTESITATAAIDLDVTGTGSWTEVDSFSFVKSGTVSGSGTSNQNRTIYHASLTTSSKFRVRIKAITDTSAGSDVTIGASTVNYTYITSGSDQYASKTPDTGDVIYWEAFEAALT